MYTILFDLFGSLFYHLLLQLSSLSENLIPVFLFSRHLQRKKHFTFRLTLGLVLCLGLHILFAFLRNGHDTLLLRIVITLLQYISILILLFFCYQEAVSSVLLSWCAGVAAENIASRCYTLLFAIFGIDARQSISLFGSDHHAFDWVVFYLFRIMIYVILFYIFERSKPHAMNHEEQVKITGLAIFSTVLQSVLYVITLDAYTKNSILFVVIQCYSLIMWFFVLMLRSGLLFESGYRQEIAVMEQVLYEDRKQYQSLKENMDIINMKCHDLKHRFSQLSDKLTDQEILTLQEAVNIYDKNIKTGNEVLDVILYEKSLVCQQENIQLSCMANGKLLAFMHTRHLYSLFNNALNNALEAVRQLDNPSKRCIGVSVASRDQQVEISVYNYFSGNLQAGEETPLSSKSDQNHHGFGIMSMRYIVQQYEGTLQTLIDGEVFTLLVTLPFFGQNTN